MVFASVVAVGLFLPQIGLEQRLFDFVSQAHEPIDKFTRFGKSCVVSLLADKGRAAERLRPLLAALFLEKGMSREDVRGNLGIPSLEYSACGHTTYLYDKYRLQLWFESDCPRRVVQIPGFDKPQAIIMWAANPQSPVYRHRLIRAQVYDAE